MVRSVVSARGNERQDFLSEIETMKKVAESQNPHVVCLVGCVTIQEPLCLITEFVKYGDLLSYLRTNRRMVQKLSLLRYCCNSLMLVVQFTGCSYEADSNAYVELGNVRPADLLSFAYQIVSGMVNIFYIIMTTSTLKNYLNCRSTLLALGLSIEILLVEISWLMKGKY